MSEDECVMHVWKAMRKTKPMVLAPYGVRKGEPYPFTFEEIDALQQQFIREIVRIARSTAPCRRPGGPRRQGPGIVSVVATKGLGDTRTRPREASPRSALTTGLPGSRSAHPVQFLPTTLRIGETHKTARSPE